MAGYRLSGEGYTDEEMRVLKRMCKSMLADIDEFLRKKKIKRVVIPMMIFVHVDAAERSQVLTLSAISRYMVLHGEHTPAVIPDEQMERFKFMLDYSDEAVEMCTEPLAPGELIRVVKGPLKGLEGELVEVDGKAKVVVRLDLLGCAGVDMPVGFVEKMK